MRTITSIAVAIAFAAFLLLPLTAQADEEPPVAPDEEAAVETFDRLGTEKPELSSRASLVTGQTLHGGILGLQTCALAECESPRPLIGLPILGAGAGLGLSLYATHERGITAGHASAINSGTVWGAWIFGLTTGLTDFGDWRMRLAVTMAGQIAGIGAGHLAAQTLRPTGGDVLMVNSGAVWSWVYYLIIMEDLVGRTMGGRSEIAEALAVTTGGAVAAGVLASQLPMSRGRLALVNASGLVGALGGAGVPIMIAGDDAPSRAIITSMLGGSAMGLGLGTYLTREWDADSFGDGSASLSVRPTPENDGVQLGVSGKW